jgi:hypothetical protein
LIASLSVIELNPEGQQPAAAGAVVRPFRLGVVAAQAAFESNSPIIGKSAIGQARAFRATFIQAPDLTQLLKALQAQT